MVAVLKGHLKANNIAGDEMTAEEQQHAQREERTLVAQPPGRRQQCKQHQQCRQRGPRLQQAAGGLDPVVVEGHMRGQGEEDLPEVHAQHPSLGQQPFVA